MPHNLTATAESNDAARRTAARSLLTEDSTGRLADFQQLVEGSSFSTNVSADKVLAFDRANEVLDARRFHIAKEGGEDAGLARFAADQRSGLARREAFEDLWHDGRRLVYGAVNAGGMGTEGRFGPFCLTSHDPETPVPDALAVFPGDSVGRYTTAADAVDGDRAGTEATSWSHRADLAVAEVGNEALAGAEADWPAVVCRADHYFEVARAGALPTAAVSEVRLRSGYEDRLFVSWSSWLVRRPLEPVDLAQALAYDVLLRWRESHSVGVVIVP